MKNFCYDKSHVTNHFESRFPIVYIRDTNPNPAQTKKSVLSTDLAKINDCNKEEGHHELSILEQ